MAAAEEQAASSRGGLFKLNQDVLIWGATLLPLAYAGLTIDFGDDQQVKGFLVAVVAALGIYKVNEWLIPQFEPLLLKAGVHGKDLNKPGNPKDKPPMYCWR